MYQTLLFPILLALFTVGVQLNAKDDVSASSQIITPIKFRGKEYFHRWSQGGQYEFTPVGQEDLNAWTDMLTVWVYPKVTDGDGLALQANRVLTSYQNAKGKVVRTASVPRTPETPAEHFIAVMLGNPQFLEFAAARFLLVESKGIGVIYSYRSYGNQAAQELGPWVVQNGPIIEKLLMELKPAETISSLGK